MKALQPGIVFPLSLPRYNRLMPELPEVETIIRRLREGPSPPIVGLRIDSLTSAWPRHFLSPSFDDAVRILPGQTIQAISRHGKYFRFTLDDWDMLIHLRMSGDLVAMPASHPPGRFDHTRFHLSDAIDLVFQDARKFGTIEILRDAGERLSKLGPDALDPALDAERFHARLSQHKRMLKPLLLDQSFLAGMGNIYTDEALFLSRLHPRTRSHLLHPQQASVLFNTIQQTLKEGIRRNGASIDWVYRGGDFQNSFHVYQRTGEPCPVCGTPVQRIVVGQRGTHLCPTCQPEVTA